MILVSAWRELQVRPATPEIMVVWYRCGRQRLLTDTNEAEKVESSNALVFTVEPSGAWTRTLQVIRSELGGRLAAVFEETSGTDM